MSSDSQTELSNGGALILRSGRVTVLTGEGRIFCAGADLIASVILPYSHTVVFKHVFNCSDGTRDRQVAGPKQTNKTSSAMSMASRRCPGGPQRPSPSSPPSTGAHTVEAWRSSSTATWSSQARMPNLRFLRSSVVLLLSKEVSRSRLLRSAPLMTSRGRYAKVGSYCWSPGTRRRRRL